MKVEKSILFDDVSAIRIICDDDMIAFIPIYGYECKIAESSFLQFISVDLDVLHNILYLKKRYDDKEIKVLVNNDMYSRSFKDINLSVMQNEYRSYGTFSTEATEITINYKVLQGHIIVPKQGLAFHYGMIFELLKFLFTVISVHNQRPAYIPGALIFKAMGYKELDRLLHYRKTPDLSKLYYSNAPFDLGSIITPLYHTIEF